MSFTYRINKEKPSLFNRIKQKTLPYLFGVTVGLFGGCGNGDDSSSVPISPPTPPTPSIVTGPVKTDTQGEADIKDTSKNLYHIIVRDEKTLELLDNMEVYTVNHSVEIPIIDGLKDYIAELRILPSEPQTLEVLMSKLTDRVSDNLSEYKTGFHPEPINWSEGTKKINKTPIPMSQLADFYDTYESDAIVNLLEILPDLWGINTTARGLASIRTQFLQYSDEISKILGLNPDEIFYDIYRENTTGMLYHKRVDGIEVSNTRPIVEIPYLRGTFSGNINIPYNLKDAEADLCDILVEFSKDNITFLPATQGAGSDGITNLNSSLPGIDHIFVWDSKANNIGLTLEEMIKLRIIPSDIGGVGYKDKKSISIDNRNIRIAFEYRVGGYLSSNLDVYLIDNSEVKNLTNNSNWDGNFSWSPDGTKIAFVSHRDGNMEIYKMNADGSSQTNLTNNLADDGNPNAGVPSWSPDGTKIAFQSKRDGNWEIYTMNVNGTGQIRLTNNATEDKDPKWSPDGSKIAFVSHRNGNMEIYKMNPDGSLQTNLTNNLGIDENFVWSSDGNKIAFVSNRDGNKEIYIMNANGTGQTRLTNDPKTDIWPAWSPDGTKIAFESNRNGYWEVYSMNPDGSLQTDLTNNLGNNNFGPSWSPDGSKIAFVHEYAYQYHRIYIMNADGSGQTDLTGNTGKNTYSSPLWFPK